MRLAAAVTLTVFGFLILAPAVAIWGLTLKSKLVARPRPRPRKLILFPAGRCVLPERCNRQTDAA
jgi:hypothetical protein